MLSSRVGLQGQGGEKVGKEGGGGSNLPKSMTSSPTHRLDVTFVKFSMCVTWQGSLSPLKKFCSL